MAPPWGSCPVHSDTDLPRAWGLVKAEYESLKRAMPDYEPTRKGRGMGGQGERIVVGAAAQR
jgi:hypothetical protein